MHLRWVPNEINHLAVFLQVYFLFVFCSTQKRNKNGANKKEPLVIFSNTNEMNASSADEELGLLYQYLQGKFTDEQVQQYYQEQKERNPVIYTEEQQKFIQSLSEPITNQNGESVSVVWGCIWYEWRSGPFSLLLLLLLLLWLWLFSRRAVLSVSFMHSQMSLTSNQLNWCWVRIWILCTANNYSTMGTFVAAYPNNCSIWTIPLLPGSIERIFYIYNPNNDTVGFIDII